MVVRDRVRSNDVNVSGWIQDSEPPASITSASPWDMKREASPIECAPVVQAVLTEWEGPCAEIGVRMRKGRGKGSLEERGTLNPYFIDIWPAAILIRSLGTKKGETFLAPYDCVC